MTLQDQHQCFKALAGAKAYISFEDFRKLTGDRWETVEPGTEIEKSSALSKEVLSSEEIRNYLQSLSNDELDTILANRKSSKRLDGGPMIFSHKAPFGHASKGFSVPKEIKYDTTREYGKGTYHNVEHPPMKDLITNAFNKDILLEKVQNHLV